MRTRVGTAPSSRLITTPAHKMRKVVGRGEERSFGVHYFHLLNCSRLASPASASCSPVQTTEYSAVLAFSLFRFRPAFGSSPISLCVRVSLPRAPLPHLTSRSRSSGVLPLSFSTSAAVSFPHLLPQAGVCQGRRRGGGGGGGGREMEFGAGGRNCVRGHGAGSPSIPPPREQERKLEQEKLSGVVKSVHRRLRKKYREGKQ